MGINQRKLAHKSKRHKLTSEEILERDLKDCMHCRFFWGNDSRCVKSNCCKSEKPKQNEVPQECRGCPYYKGNGYCFPCMRKLTGR
jgi:hypothetical protein